jgi:single stranded DNA-binding protein
MSTITFTGNIGKYHGLKFNNDGKARSSFSAAETARIKDQSGQWSDGGTTWFNVTLFGAAAEALDAAIPDGKGKVIVTGRMSTREYEHNGEKRESLDVVADSVGLVPRTNQQQSAGHSRNQAQTDPWGAPVAATGNNTPGAWSNGPQDPPF